MMNNPIFRNYIKPSPKVISVPVQFISSDQSQTKPKPKPSISNNSAAITIQKVFRSFLVRKCINNIKSVKTDVMEIERKLNDIETVNLIRNHPKERLRVNERLMSLLFKLDSIRGIDSGVRDFRKTVTKKAIALQEKVDAIAQFNDSNKVTETVANDEVVKEVVEDSRVLEKLMDDNEKMMKVMKQVYERNEMQTRMINSLSRRVELLEKGFMNDHKLRKKKKTNSGLRRRDRHDFYF